MKTTPAAEARTAATERADRNTRMASWFALGMLVPALIGSGLIVLSTTRASGCLTYGVECADVPQGWIPGCLVAAVVLGVAAVAWPRKWLPFASARGWLLGLHIVAQLMMVSLILSYA
ncbi:hypothetical protein [Streptomyces sp. NBC_01618]|uniref:hypothetical protein n=1 Tax=Streptomyces sp. NBC_01618 TaxID=2975900 RepID=UPI00386C0FE0|nr:hypothetical protein OH735_08150 [Streptomyces sp. NBC_01618]